jgi:hypothetical protein
MRNIINFKLTPIVCCRSRIPGVFGLINLLVESITIDQVTE